MGPWVWWVTSVRQQDLCSRHSGSQRMNWKQVWGHDLYREKTPTQMNLRFIASAEGCIFLVQGRSQPRQLGTNCVGGQPSQQGRWCPMKERVGMCVTEGINNSSPSPDRRLLQDRMEQPGKHSLLSQNIRIWSQAHASQANYNFSGPQFHHQ